MTYGLITQEEVERSRVAVLASGIPRYVVAMIPEQEGAPPLVVGEFVTDTEANLINQMNNMLAASQGLGDIYEVRQVVG